MDEGYSGSELRLRYALAFMLVLAVTMAALGILLHDSGLGSSADETRPCLTTSQLGC